jgi:hypothetical protein
MHGDFFPTEEAMRNVYQKSQVWDDPLLNDIF